ncbi:hypothetical protein ABD76_14960 [Paenibacillus dendritiformis]|nr:hypothetical protein [Paenibacillus dendritiformis]
MIVSSSLYRFLKYPAPAFHIPTRKKRKAKKHLQEGLSSPFLRVLPSQVPVFVIRVNGMKECEICQGEQIRIVSLLAKWVMGPLDNTYRVRYWEKRALSKYGR